MPRLGRPLLSRRSAGSLRLTSAAPTTFAASSRCRPSRLQADHRHLPLPHGGGGPPRPAAPLRRPLRVRSTARWPPATASPTWAPARAPACRCSTWPPARRIAALDAGLAHEHQQRGRRRPPAGLRARAAGHRGLRHLESARARPARPAPRPGSLLPHGVHPRGHRLLLHLLVGRAAPGVLPGGHPRRSRPPLWRSSPPAATAPPVTPEEEQAAAPTSSCTTCSCTSGTAAPWPISPTGSGACRSST